MKLSIVGTGLIGGSIGLTALDRSLVDRVTGFDIHPDRAQKALAKSAITHIAESAGEAVRDADLVIIATPVSEVVQTFEEIAGQLKDGAIVTDVGSTKSRIVSQIGSLSTARASFIGGHPIAGSEAEGIEAAQPDLYAGCFWILTPTSSTEATEYKNLVSFISGLGARVISLDPHRHDELVALTSHLPQILASVLMAYAWDRARENKDLPLITAGGFRDMTRIAASSPDLWIDILKDNREAVSEILAGFEAALRSAEGMLRGSKWEDLRSLFDHARTSRMGLREKPGVVPEELAMLLIAVPDRPGVLSDVTTAIGEVGVNIEDMEITHSSEGGKGTIRLTLSGEQAAELATKALEQKGYVARRIDG